MAIKYVGTDKVTQQSFFTGLSTDTPTVANIPYGGPLVAGSIIRDSNTGNVREYDGTIWSTTKTAGSAHIFASATSAGAVTPSDTTVLDFNAIYVGGAGNVSIDLTEGGTAVVFVAIPAGTILPVIGTRVNATGTTATSMVWMKW